MGVVSLNLPQIGILADGDEEKFFQILDKRLELCKKPCSCASTSSSASRPTYRLSTGSTALLPA